MALKTDQRTLTDWAAVRHYFHQHPELSSKESETTVLIHNYLSELGYRIVTPPGLKTGVLAEIGPEDAEHTIALRADIDALPIQEQTNLDFSSQNAGVMHACGHDLHLTSLLAASQLLKEHEKEIKIKVRLLFQPAEETNVGAKEVLENNGLTDVEAIVGFHNQPRLPVGQISVQSGPRTAAVDKFAVTFHGVGGHAAKPHENIDPIVGLANTITALQTVISRTLNPNHQSVLSVTHIEGGKTWNVIPDDAWFEGTIRTFGGEDRELAHKQFYQVVEAQAASYGLKAEIDWQPGPPVLQNSPQLTPFLAEAIADQAELVDMPATAGGEDFAYYTEEIPSVFAFIGSGANNGLHHSDLVVDDGTLKIGAAWYVRSVYALQAYFAKEGNK
ncbi:amidohydrolase [Lactobacillaceae bacterium L1_55_11]|nr:amidohydrolase [Lactobacillaceae bacterium L1_55_11]